MTEDEIQVIIDEIREAHKALHGPRKVQKQVLIERLEDGRTIEETINKGNSKGTRYILEHFGKGKKTTKK